MIYLLLTVEIAADAVTAAATFCSYFCFFPASAAAAPLAATAADAIMAACSAAAIAAGGLFCFCCAAAATPSAAMAADVDAKRKSRGPVGLRLFSFHHYFISVFGLFKTASTKAPTTLPMIKAST